MTRFIGSLLLGLALGSAIGLYLGWKPFPSEVVNTRAVSLDAQYKDDYTVMIARGYLADGDAVGAVERLRILGVSNVPLYVQEITERYISLSRNVDDVTALISLSAGLGRLTPLMERYRLPESSP